MDNAATIDICSHTRHVQRLFILGAGFSRSISNDFPLTCDLLKDLFNEDPILHKKWANLSSLFTPFLRTQATGTPEITSVLTFLEAYRAIVAKRGKADAEIREVRSRVLHAAATLLYRISNNARTSSVLRDFIGRINPKKDAILTMNWDVVIEYGLTDANVDFQYDILPAVSGLDAPKDLLVLKPQGSVHWLRHRPTPSISEPVLHVEPPPPNPDWILSQRLGAPPAFASLALTEPDPAIIPPGFSSEDRAEGEINWSGYLLKVATYAALRAKSIVVIGYALPPGDFHILTALSLGLPQDLWGDGVTVYVIDPLPETFQKWKNAFNGIATFTPKPITVCHWEGELFDALKRPGGPWS